ncbi:unnamed protein product [Trichobilharzia regenti]|nr:unnamed protein product [Trichobilharzia regenti]
MSVLTCFSLLLQLETKIHNLKHDEPLNIEILRYLKQIHFDAQRKLKLIQAHLLQTTDRSYCNKLSTNKNETFILPRPPPPIPLPPSVPAGTAVAPPPPPIPRLLPAFTTGCRQMKTQSSTSTTTVDDINPRSKSCNIYERSTHHNHNNKSLELPRIVDKTRQEKKNTNGNMSKSVGKTKKQPVDEEIRRSEENHES